MTCDAWTSSSGDGFFATTLHIIEEVEPGVWVLRSDLVGFVSIQEAHTGERFGQALYKIACRVGVENKVSINLHYLPVLPPFGLVSDRQDHM